MRISQAAAIASRACKDIAGYFKFGIPGSATVVMLRETELAVADIDRYNDSVAAKTEPWDLEEPALFDAFIVLGCPHIRHAKVCTPPPVKSKNSDVLQVCMHRLLGACFPTFDTRTLPSLIAGVARHGLCLPMVSGETGAYAVAVGLLEYIEYTPGDTYEYMNRHGRFITGATLLRAATGSDVLAMINAWIKPETPWVDIKDVRSVACALFGDAWVSMFELTAGVGISIAGAVYLERPPFLPGLCPAQAQQQQVELPMGLSL